MKTAATGGKATTCGTCDKPEAYRAGRCLGPRDPSKPACPVQDIPDWAWGVLALYNRCQARQALPYPGGVLDQPERLMRFFDVIDSEIARFQDRNRKRAPAPEAASAKARGQR